MEQLIKTSLSESGEAVSWSSEIRQAPNRLFYAFFNSRFKASAREQHQSSAASLPHVDSALTVKHSTAERPPLNTETYFSLYSLNAVQDFFIIRYLLLRISADFIQSAHPHPKRATQLPHT